MTTGNASLENQLNKWVLRVFVLFWGLFIWLDYSYHSGYYGQALHSFPRWGMFFILMLLPGGYGLIRRNNKELNSQFQLKGVAGWHLVVCCFLIQLITAGMVASEAGLLESNALERLGYFFMFNVGQTIVLGLIVLSAYILGSPLTGLLPNTFTTHTRSLGSIAIGFTVLTLLLFLLGALSLLTASAVGVILLVILGVGWRRALTLIKETLLRKGKPIQLHPAFLWIGFILLTFIAMNLVSMNRPMPLGFDAMNLYANKPNLLDQYGTLTQGGQAYNWSLIMSLGFVLFDSTSLGLLLSMVPGILSVFVVFRLARLYLNTGWSLLASTLFYTLPVITWQSTQEAKVDLALLFILLTALLLWLEKRAGSRKGHNDTNPEKKTIYGRLGLWAQRHSQAIIWIFIGILMGYGLGIKYTTVFAIVAFMVMALWRHLGTLAYWGGYLGAFAFLFGLGFYRFSSVDIRVLTAAIIFILGLVAGVTMIIIAWKRARKPKLFPVARSWGWMLGMALVVFSPWVIKNVSEAGSFSISAILNGRSNLPAIHDMEFQNQGQSFEPGNPSFIPPPLPILYAQNDIDQDLGSEPASNDRRVKSGVYEELSRYVGYEKGVMRFLSLPYDLTMRTNVNNYAGDISFLFLLFLPLLMLVPRPGQLKWNILKMVILLLWLGASYYSVWFNEGVVDRGAYQALLGEQIGSQPLFWTASLGTIYEVLAELFYIIGSGMDLLLTTPIITSERFLYLFVVASVFGVFFLYRSFISELSNKGRWLVAFLVIYGMTWFVFGSGIVWYGMLLLALSGTFVAFAFVKFGCLFGDRINWYVGVVFISIWLLSTLLIRFSHTNPIEDPSFQVYDNTFLKYQLGLSTAEEAVNEKISIYTPVLQVINQDTESQVLRIGTFMNYFIKENDRRVYIDNQLNLFNYFNSLGETKEEVATKMREAGIRFIIFAFNTGADDATPEKTVQTKAQAFYQFVFNNPNIRLIYTDRIMADPNGQETITRSGQSIRVTHQVFGRTEQVVEPGTYAAFEVL